MERPCKALLLLIGILPPAVSGRGAAVVTADVQAGQAGSTPRVSEPDVEQIILKGLRQHLAGTEAKKEEAAIED